MAGPGPDHRGARITGGGWGRRGGRAAWQGAAEKGKGQARGAGSSGRRGPPRPDPAPVPAGVGNTSVPPGCRRHLGTGKERASARGGPWGVLTLPPPLRRPPGVVPLPDTAIDFSDLRSAAPRKPERSQEDWTVCDRCEAYRPPRAHHCRICHRCVRRMDHHCPWINNCVGELNQKYFIQFLFYAGLASLYAAGLVLAAWLGPVGRSPAGMAAGGDVANNRVQTAHCIILLLESLFFGAFVTVVFYDQVVSIITDKTPLEQLRNRGLKEMNREGPRPLKPKLVLLREVFGRGFVLCWLFPWSCSTAPGTGPMYSPLPSRYV
ncbi:PREDICTED: probable palmitoyltransferase ZDHHC21 [Haliaeetus leucocephalus]|uniref:probable palmitoyltransferase ZDHHC21 n=1 Tax=Haliaeetus leucocephalus TaxID=52644 RepID=UPI00053CD4CF|nr:PREDICTED: probable palmitoyltransferase ZDHHC21 [Haliaeetus leucocephalus]